MWMLAPFTRSVPQRKRENCECFLGFIAVRSTSITEGLLLRWDSAAGALRDSARLLGCRRASYGAYWAAAGADNGVSFSTMKVTNMRADVAPVLREL